MFASIMRGPNILLRETADVVFLLCTHLLNRWRNDMRPKRYPYSKPQWEKEYANVYWELSDETVATFVTYVNRVTGEIK